MPYLFPATIHDRFLQAYRLSERNDLSRTAHLLGFDKPDATVDFNAYGIFNNDRRTFKKTTKRWAYKDLAIRNGHTDFLDFDKRKEDIDQIIGECPERINYQLQTNRYLGFGYLLSFIRGSDAYKARIAFSKKLEKIIPDFISYMHEASKNCTPSVHWRIGASGLAGWISAAPIWKTLSMLYDGYTCHSVAISNTITVNNQMSFPRLLFRLPVLRDIAYFDTHRTLHYREDAVERMIHTIVNPLRLARRTLDFFHYVFNRIFEIGGTRGTRSSVPRIILKGLTAIIFGSLKAPIIIGERLLDIPYNIVKAVGNGVINLCSNVKQLIMTHDKRLVTATVEEVRTVKTLRRAAKGREDTNYTQLTQQEGEGKAPTEYLSHRKRKLYESKSTSGLADDDLVTMRMEKTKASPFNTALTLFPQPPVEISNELVEEAKEAIPQWNLAGVK